MQEHFTEGLAGRVTYADYACGAQSHRFIDKLPPMEEKLPPCPECGGPVRITDVLVELPT